MYTLTQTKQPLPLNFSRNPIVCAYNISPYGPAEVSINTTLSIKFEVIADSGLHTRVFQLRPDAQGNVKLDLQNMIDIHLEHYVPSLDSYALQGSNINMCSFRISAVAINDYEQVGIVPTATYRAMKGGLPVEQNLLEQFLGDNLLLKHQFLRYPFSGETKEISEVFIVSALAYISDNPTLISTPGDVELSYRYRSISNNVANEWHTQTSDLGIQLGGVVHLPFCIKDLLPDYAIAQSVEIEIVLNILTETFVIGSQKFFISNKRAPSYNCIAYINSLGGYDTIGIYDYNEKQFEISKKKAEHIDLNEFASKNVIKATSAQFDIRERATPKLQTLPLTQKELDRLRALFLCPVAYIFRNKRMVPLVVSDSSLSITTTEGLFSIFINLEELVSNSNYMPENAIDQDSVCPVPQLFVVTHVESNIVTIKYAFATNRYNGVLIINRSLPPIEEGLELDLTQNEGEISVDVSALNVTTTPMYAIDVSLKTICSEGVESAPLQKSLLVSRFSKPTVPVLNADTYSGGGFRTLDFAHGSNSMFDNAATNISTFAWVMGRANEFLNIPSGTSAAGGSFSLTVINSGWTNQTTRLSYSPPAGFSGMDVINYYAYTKIPVLGTSFESMPQPAKVYINVQPVEDGTTPPPTAPVIVYVRLDIDQTKEKVEGWVTDKHKFTYYRDSYLRFFADPYGNTPLDITGMNIKIEIDGSFDGDAAYWGATSGDDYWFTFGTGTSVYFKYKTRHERKKKKTYFTYELKTSNMYYIIH